MRILQNRNTRAGPGGLDWADLEVFLAVVRAGTLAGAGVALGVDPSTVQRRIGRLERDLETRLFDRSQQGYALTASAEALITHATEMEEVALAVQRTIAGRDAALSGTVRIDTVDDLATVLLPQVLRDFRDAHPQVTVEVTVRTGFADLGRRQADVALRFGGPPSAPDVVGRHVGPARVALYAARSYLATHPIPLQAADLGTHDLVCGDARMAHLPIERFMETHGAPDRIAFRSNSFLARVAAVRAGLGMGFLPAFVAADDPCLQRVVLPGLPRGADIYLLVHVDLRRNARVRAFIDFAHARLAAGHAQLDPYDD